MYTPIVNGVDPGIVHTGIVSLTFDVGERALDVAHAVVDGPDATAAAAALRAITDGELSLQTTFIEEYRPRSGFSVDQAMMVANADFKRALHGHLLRNTGVKQVVSKELMELLHVWKFSTTTHHQDLRSAARIAILGMLLEPSLNRILYQFTTDNIDGRTWEIHVD